MSTSHGSASSPLGKPLAIDTVFRVEYREAAAEFKELGTSEDDFVFSRRQDFGLTEHSTIEKQKEVFAQIAADRSHSVSEKALPSEEQLKAEFRKFIAEH